MHHLTMLEDNVSNSRSAKGCCAESCYGDGCCTGQVVGKTVVRWFRGGCREGWAALKINFCIYFARYLIPIYIYETKAIYIYETKASTNFKFSKFVNTW